jgi:DNA-binding response OmpR family regulator
MSDKGAIRILIIEDDIEYRHLLRLQLSVVGYATEVAEDGVEGGKAILARPPNLILCDINMPHLSGLELVALMRTDEHSASIPVIFMSGSNDGDTLARAVALGAADFLAKPITHAELLASVEACLKAGGRRPVARDVGFPPVV